VLLNFAGDPDSPSTLTALDGGSETLENKNLVEYKWEIPRTL
jgi:hypothetical protein